MSCCNTNNCNCANAVSAPAPLLKFSGVVDDNVGGSFSYLSDGIAAAGVHSRIVYAFPQTESIKFRSFSAMYMANAPLGSTFRFQFLKNGTTVATIEFTGTDAPFVPLFTNVSVSFKKGDLLEVRVETDTVIEALVFATAMMSK